VEWKEGGKTFAQPYDKVSPVNTSWQNLAAIPEKLGQHKQVGDKSDSGFRVEYRDTVESRRDVRYPKGMPFRSLQASQFALLVLIGWVAICYAAIRLSLLRKQTGK
jgi:hypothetical protein